MDEKFINIISAELEIPKELVTEGYLLEQCEAWDSMGMICVMTAIDDGYGIELEDDSLLSCRTIGDINTLIK
tara:strand:+ start:394 stop:609 length:216 start_codon:yes stop_codon:yes gene_type:complete